jgi:cobalt transporter subunit CbtA
MLLRRIFFCALLVGLCGGLVHSAIQRWQVVPLILAAEAFESTAQPESPTHAQEHAHEHAHEGGHDAAHAHDHAATEWAPSDGLERTGWTLVANVLSGTGYALLLLPLIALWDRRRGGRAASWRSGALWGAAAWLCLFAWPALGLPPELPGTAAAALHARQGWWLLSAASAAAGLALLCFGRERVGHWRWLGLALLALPLAIGAPQHDGALFPGQDASAVLQLQALSGQFVTATALATAAYWLTLGTLAGMAVARWLRPLLAAAPGGARATARGRA